MAAHVCFNSSTTAHLSGLYLLFSPVSQFIFVYKYCGSAIVSNNFICSIGIGCFFMDSLCWYLPGQTGRRLNLAHE